MARVNKNTHPVIIWSGVVIAVCLVMLSQFGGFAPRTSTDLLLGPIVIVCGMLMFWAAPQSRLLAFLLLWGAVTASPWRDLLMPNERYFSLDFNLHFIYVVGVTWLIVVLIAAIDSDRLR